MQILENIIKQSFNTLIKIVQFLIFKDEKMVIVGGWRGKRYADNSRYLFEYLNQHKTELNLSKVIWITENTEISQELKSRNLEVYKKKSLKSIYYHFKAKYHIVDQGLKDIFGELSASSKTKKINLWHGIPLKKIGKYMPDYRKTDIKFGNWQNQFVLTCCENSTKLIGDAFNIKDEKCIYGIYPRNYYLLNDDNYLSDKEKEIMQKISDKIKEGKKIIFYLPTFRDKAQILFLGENNLQKLNDFFEFLASNNYFFVTKLHFAGTSLANREKDSFNANEKILNLPSDMDICPFLKKTDILITDYSSVYFDFLYLDRDIIFYPYDLDYYKNQDRGFIIDFDENTPGDKVYSLKELTDNLKEKNIKRDGYHQQRKELLAKYFGEETMLQTAKNLLK